MTTTMTTPDYLATATVNDVIAAVKFAAENSADLLRPSFRRQVEAGAHPLTGHCYVACEVLADLLGADYTPHTLRHNGGVHWYLEGVTDGVMDVTAAQFDAAPDYTAGRGRGFLTSALSRRAVALRGRVMLRLSWIASMR